MKSAFRSTISMVIVLFAALVVTGCAKIPPKTEPAPPPPAAEAKKEARKIVVAKVNGAELTMDALLQMMNRLPDKKGGAPETLEERKKRALDAIVLLELAYQRANALGLSADPVQVEIAVKNFKNDMSEKDYNDYLFQHNITMEDVRAEVERNMTITLIYNKEVVESLLVPEEEMKQYYEKEKEHLIKPEKMFVFDVYLLKDEGKASQKKAKELLKKLKADPNQDPWKLVLDGTFMVRELVVQKDRNKEIYEAGKKLTPQSLSGIIRDSKGILHIIKLMKYSPERPKTFDEAKPDIEAKLKAPLEEKRTHEWEEELKRDAKIVLTDVTMQEEQKKTP